MRILVCGGRNFSDKEYLFFTLDGWHNGVANITTIIHGAARGTDMMAGWWAKAHRILELRYPAQWGIYGRAAGSVRNQQMLDEGKPDHVIAFPGGRGTAHMVGLARKANIPVTVVEQF